MYFLYKPKHLNEGLPLMLKKKDAILVSVLVIKHIVIKTILGIYSPQAHKSHLFINYQV